MGTWSGEPFGNDEAADWAWELDGADDWDIVRTALRDVIDGDHDAPDADAATLAIAAAEVVAHHRGRPTQSDSYTESVSSVVSRVSEPPADMVAVALTALDIATAPGGELAELWSDDDEEWRGATDRLREALSLPAIAAPVSGGSRKAPRWRWGAKKTST